MRGETFLEIVGCNTGQKNKQPEIGRESLLPLLNQILKYYMRKKRAVTLGMTSALQS